MESNTNILIVDDSEKGRFGLRSVLEDRGYNLVEASSGPQALRTLLDQEFVVVLLDVVMAGMDGFETAKFIRAREKTRRLPIIFVTSLGHEESEVIRGYSCGAVDYIMTPVVPEILQAKVAVFVDLFRMTLEIKRQAELLHRARERENEIRNTELLAKKAEELERSNMELERFAFAASHDMQEPLRTIISYSQLLEQLCKDKLSTEEQEFLQFIVGGASRMQHMIRSLLDYSLLKGKEKAKPRRVDCRNILENTLASLDKVIRDNEAVVTCDPLPMLFGHEGQLSQLFQNLISNAIKFRAEERPAINVSVEREEAFWKFCVQDNGIGIEPQYREEVFGIFKRLHARDRYPGAGLGLSLCKKIVENHGGRVWVEEAPGRGSRFYFTLPVAEEVENAVANL